jgi:hypothetical protein
MLARVPAAVSLISVSKEKGERLRDFLPACDDQEPGVIGQRFFRWRSRNVSILDGF